MLYISAYLRRKNGIMNDFEHSANPKIAKGIIFHHSGVTITSETVIETGVHIYRNVTFGAKNERHRTLKKMQRLQVIQLF